MKSQPITGTAFLELELLDPKANPPLAFDWPKPRYPYVPSAPSGMSRSSRAQPVVAKLEKLDTEKIGRQIESTLAAAEEDAKRIGRFDVEGVSAGAKGTLAERRDGRRDPGPREDARTKVQGWEAEIGQDVRRSSRGSRRRTRRCRSPSSASRASTSAS